MAGVVVERVVSALTGFVVEETPWVLTSYPVDDSTLTVVDTIVLSGTAVVFVSVVGCMDVTTGNEVCVSGRDVLGDVDVSDNEVNSYPVVWSPVVWSVDTDCDSVESVVHTLPVTVGSVFVMGAIEVFDVTVLCVSMELSVTVVLFAVVDKESVDVWSDDVEGFEVTNTSCSVECLICAVEAVKITSVVGPLVKCSGLLDVDKTSRVVVVSSSVSGEVYSVVINQISYEM